MAAIGVGPRARLGEAMDAVSRGEDVDISAIFDPVFAGLVAEGRITEAEFDRATDELARGEKTQRGLLLEFQKYGGSIGMRLRLTGLKGRTALNGLYGKIISFDTKKRRYGVRLVTGETLAVRPENVHFEEEFEDTSLQDTAEVLCEAVGPDAASVICGFLTCTRCQQRCVPGSRCRVPHPPHLREDRGGMCGPNGMQTHYRCGGCGESYTVCSDPTGEQEDRIVGPAYCYEGCHTTRKLPPSDLRRVDLTTHALVYGPKLQDEIDALPDDTV